MKVNETLTWNLGPHCLKPTLSQAAPAKSSFPSLSQTIDLLAHVMETEPTQYTPSYTRADFINLLTLGLKKAAQEGPEERRTIARNHLETIEWHLADRRLVEALNVNFAPQGRERDEITGKWMKRGRPDVVICPREDRTTSNWLDPQETLVWQGNLAVSYVSPDHYIMLAAKKEPERVRRVLAKVEGQAKELRKRKAEKDEDEPDVSRLAARKCSFADLAKQRAGKNVKGLQATAVEGSENREVGHQREAAATVQQYTFELQSPQTAEDSSAMSRDKLILRMKTLRAEKLSDEEIARDKIIQKWYVIREGATSTNGTN